jgi:hypothetical protein
MVLELLTAISSHDLEKSTHVGVRLLDELSAWGELYTIEFPPVTKSRAVLA